MNIGRKRKVDIYSIYRYCFSLFVCACVGANGVRTCLRRGLRIPVEEEEMWQRVLQRLSKIQSFFFAIVAK